MPSGLLQDLAGYEFVVLATGCYRKGEGLFSEARNFPPAYINFRDRPWRLRLQAVRLVVPTACGMYVVNLEAPS